MLHVRSLRVTLNINQSINCWILKLLWLLCLYLINVKQWLLTTELNSISMNLCQPYWKSQGISRALKSSHPDFKIVSSPLGHFLFRLYQAVPVRVPLLSSSRKCFQSECSGALWVTGKVTVSLVLSWPCIADWLIYLRARCLRKVECVLVWQYYSRQWIHRGEGLYILQSHAWEAGSSGDKCPANFEWGEPVHFLICFMVYSLWNLKYFVA